MVELCNARVNVLALDEETILREARNLTKEKMMYTIREVSSFARSRLQNF